MHALSLISHPSPLASQVDAGVPILNVSTYLTNVTLVERQHLESTLATLSDELEAAIDCDFSRMDG